MHFILITNYKCSAFRLFTALLFNNVPLILARIEFGDDNFLNQQVICFMSKTGNTKLRAVSETPPLYLLKETKQSIGISFLLIETSTCRHFLRITANFDWLPAQKTNATFTDWNGRRIGVLWMFLVPYNLLMIHFKNVHTLQFNESERACFNWLSLSAVH